MSSRAPVAHRRHPGVPSPSPHWHASSCPTHGLTNDFFAPTLPLPGQASISLCGLNLGLSGLSVSSISHRGLRAVSELELILCDALCPLNARNSGYSVHPLATPTLSWVLSCELFLTTVIVLCLHRPKGSRRREVSAGHIAGLQSPVTSRCVCVILALLDST